jgi:hypothetical protein
MLNVRLNEQTYGAPLYDITFTNLKRTYLKNHLSFMNEMIAYTDAL